MAGPIGSKAQHADDKGNRQTSGVKLVAAQTGQQQQSTADERAALTRTQRARATAKRAKEIMESSPYYSGEAVMFMSNLLYDPLAIDMLKEAGINDEAMLLGLTSINNSRECFYWAAQITKNAALLKKVRLDEATKYDDVDLPAGQRHWPLSKIFRVAFLISRRSVDMKAFEWGNKLAQEQQITKSEEQGEAEDMNG